MKNYTEFLNERKRHKLTIKDNEELHDFLLYVKENMQDQPNLLRAAYARMQNILNEIRKGNVPKKILGSFFNTIFKFIENGYYSLSHELKQWRDRLITTDPEEYNTLLRIIDEYNQLLHKNKNDLGYVGNEKPFNIKAWHFEPEGIEPVKESIKDDDNIQRMFMSDDITPKEKEELKFHLPRKSIKDIDDDRDWKVGDVALIGDLHYLVTENYEDFCDFGCGYIATYLKNNPGIDEDEFGEYVTQHNKADRDMGELQDISKEEIERLGKEFKNKLLKESLLLEYGSTFGLSEIDRLFKIQGYDQKGADVMKKLVIRNFKNGGDEAVLKFLKKTLGVEVFNVSKGKYSFEPYS